MSPGSWRDHHQPPELWQKAHSELSALRVTSLLIKQKELLELLLAESNTRHRELQWGNGGCLIMNGATQEVTLKSPNSLMACGFQIP